MGFCHKCGNNLKSGTVRCRQCGTYATSLEGVITSTSSGIDGYEVYQYLGIVHSVEMRLNGIVPTVEEGAAAVVSEIEKMKEQALVKIKESAENLGGNAIIGLRSEVSEYGEKGYMVNMEGTAVFALPLEMSMILGKLYVSEKEQKQVLEYESHVSTVLSNTETIANTNLGHMIIKYMMRFPEGDSAIHISKALSKSISQQELSNTLGEMVEKGILLKSDAGLYVLSESVRSVYQG